jgi:hypothetical protein
MGRPNGAELDAVILSIVGDGDELLVTTDLRRGVLAWLEVCEAVPRASGRALDSLA